jgi:predicted adenylyl cyclase CyaB
MPSNIEIKARVSDLDALRTRVEPISDTSGEVLEQEDVFFNCPTGRLKLRIPRAGVAELIHYHRDDVQGPKQSRYTVARTSNPEAMKQILSSVLGVLGVVKKRRRLYLIGQTRVHLDRVQDLGDFVELEVVLGEGQTAKDGVGIAEGLMSRLGISPDQLLAKAYIDLLMPCP